MWTTNIDFFYGDTARKIASARVKLEGIYRQWQDQGSPALKDFEHPLFSNLRPDRDTPVVLLGAGNGFGLYFIAEACRSFNVVGIIDNYRAGETECGIRIGKDESLDDLKRLHPSLIAVSLAVGPAGILHFSRLTARVGVPCLERPEALRKFSIPSSHFSEERIGEKTISILPALLASTSGFADDLSELTYLSVLLYRVTLRREFAWSVCIGTEQLIYCPSIFEYTDNETLVDGGAFTGDSITPFLQVVGGWYNRIHAFEPDPDSFVELHKTLRKLPRSQAYLKGLARKADTLRFAAGHAMGSYIDENGSSSIEVVAVDEVVDGPVTFIKLNVEGAECDALEGARRTISTYRPKMAVSVDHLPDDLITIPEKIRSIEDGYDIFIRHHSNEYWRAYLYARPKT